MQLFTRLISCTYHVRQMCPEPATSLADTRDRWGSVSSSAPIMDVRQFPGGSVLSTPYQKISVLDTGHVSVEELRGPPYLVSPAPSAMSLPFTQFGVYTPSGSPGGTLLHRKCAGGYAPCGQCAPLLQQRKEMAWQHQYVPSPASRAPPLEPLIYIPPANVGSAHITDPDSEDGEQPTHVPSRPPSRGPVGPTPSTRPPLSNDPVIPVPNDPPQTQAPVLPSWGPFVSPPQPAAPVFPPGGSARSTPSPPPPGVVLPEVPAPPPASYVTPMNQRDIPGWEDPNASRLRCDEPFEHERASAPGPRLERQWQQPAQTRAPPVPAHPPRAAPPPVQAGTAPARARASAAPPAAQGGAARPPHAAPPFWTWRYVPPLQTQRDAHGGAARGGWVLEPAADHPVWGVAAPEPPVVPETPEPANGSWYIARDGGRRVSARRRRRSSASAADAEAAEAAALAAASHVATAGAAAPARAGAAAATRPGARWPPTPPVPTRQDWPPPPPLPLCGTVKRWFRRVGRAVFLPSRRVRFAEL
jgi:hypothetical protein